MPRLVAQMIVKNEEHRYLKSVLQQACTWADHIIVLDDGSTDSTVSICQSFAPKVQVFSTTFGRSMFSENEAVLRESLWELVRKEAKQGDWIVSLDADEEFSSNFGSWAKGFVASGSPYDYITFKLLDMWSPTHYRVDGMWSPLITRMFRYQDKPFGMTGTIHCGCVPAFAWRSRKELVKADIKLKHLGWIDDQDKDRKYKFYMERAVGFNLLHAKSVVTPATLHAYTEELPPVLVASLIRNRAWCLPEFLKSLDKQATTYPSNLLSFLFIVNDSIDDSEVILKKWAADEGRKYKQVQITTLNFNNADAVDHTWSEQKLQNMAAMRDKCLDALRASDASFLFSIDSDVIMQQSDTLKHLVHLDKSIVSEVFWATWENTAAKPMPNVWLSGGYHLTDGFVSRLKHPGLYEVGGLGAITLIHRDVLDKGVSYQRVGNLPSEMRGEDRDFCVRVTCAGLKLWADTCRTPKHLERTEAQKKELDFLLKKRQDTLPQPAPEVLSFPPGDHTVSLCMIVKNEARNIQGAISSVLPFVQEVIVVDTGSADGTQAIAQQFTDKVFDFPWTDDFSAARNFALSKASGKWILFLDGDELVPPETLKHFYQVIRGPEVAAVLVPVKNVHLPTKEKPSNYHYSETYRLFKNNIGIRYEGYVHEDIAESLEVLTKKQKVSIVRSTQFITNLGFLLKTKNLQAKHEYYGKLLLKEITRRPDHFKAYYEYAVFLLDKGEYDEAQKYYDKSLELNPKFWMSLNDSSVILMKKAVDVRKLVEAAGYLDLAAITADKRASTHQQQVIHGNMQIVRQMLKFFNIDPNSDEFKDLPSPNRQNVINTV